MKIPIAVSFSEAGFTLIKLRSGTESKKPVALRWQKTDYTFPEDVPELLEGWRGNYGIVLGKRDLCIDCDPRNYAKGDNPLRRLTQDAGFDPREFAAIVKTGGGGLHIYLTIPGNLKIKEKQKQYEGLEFKTFGRYLVGPGSIHPETKNIYVMSPAGKSIEGALDAPEALLEIITSPDVETPNLDSDKTDIEEVKDDDEQVEARYTTYLQTTGKAVEGKSGDETTYAVACHGRDLGLSQEKTYDMMSILYNPRCEPPWTPGDLQIKVGNAYQYATGKVGQSLPQTDFEKVENTEPEVIIYDRTETNRMKKTMRNIGLVFKDPDHPFVDSIRRDLWWEEVRIMKRLPWQDSDVTDPFGVPWTDEDTTQLAYWLSCHVELEMPLVILDKCVEVIASWNKVNPLKDWLMNLRWDGKPRIEEWLIKYAGAKDDKYVRAVSKTTLMQAVRRALHPGQDCKVDEMLVLEGDQGLGKSKLVEALGGVFFGDVPIDPKNPKETAIALRPYWIAEMSEMEVTRKADAKTIKAFLSKKFDVYRPVYGKRSGKVYRRFIFIGTVNRDATGEYLYDETGNRRFLPVEVHMFLEDEFKAVREQLFAEAVERYLSGELTYIKDEKIKRMATKEQRERLSSEPWFEIIEDYVLTQKKHFVQGVDVWIYALKGGESNYSKSCQKRIVRCLKDLGYESTHMYIKHRTVWGYVNKSYKPTKEEKKK